MTRDESLDIVAMILSHWRQTWTVDEIDAYARAIQDLEAETTTSALVRAVRSMSFPPKVNELRELYRSERARLAAPLPAVESKPTPLPNWVRRWICARFLWKRFGRDEPDMRVFEEQGYWGDATQERMPEGAWEEEAASLDERTLRKAFAAAPGAGEESF